MIFVCPGDFYLDLEVVCRAKTMKTLHDHRAADVDSLSDLVLFNLPRAAGWTLMSMAAKILRAVRVNDYTRRQIENDQPGSHDFWRFLRQF